MKNHRLQSLGYDLVKLSLGEDSLLDYERVSKVIAVLKEVYEERELKSVLCSYLTALEKFITQTSMKIEHCGDLPNSSVEILRSHFEKILKRKLLVSVECTDDLIAGIRISIADLIIENSIAGTLNAYKKSMETR
ncbi:MAG: F0F1 ATP synthase subunit delta [Puniceicoccales bacterium]|jgi:F0F1-type ATP synthase delta subunit|nr:F0F1 ATP synthase subunit delta [Puniceicoccales bacterium]